jgi:hypothetical protein
VLIIAALVFVSCQTVVLSLFSMVAIRWYRRERASIQEEAADALRAFVASPNADTPSPLAVLVDQMALLLAARLIQQVKAMLAGVESGASKQEQAAMLSEATAGSPWMALIAGMLPARIRNSLLRNPQMIGALSKIGGNHAAPPIESSSRSNSQTSMSL